MKNTGVYATEEEFEVLKRIASQGWREGDRVMVFSVGEGIRKDQKTVDAKEACHAVALKHGLPEIEGYYGVSFEREFVHV
jgi:hypothetical protein